MNKKTLRCLKEWVDTKINLPSNHSFFRDHPYQQWKAWSRYKIHNQKDPNLIPLTNGERRAVWHEALFFKAVWDGDYNQAKDELIELTRFACLSQRLEFGLPNFNIKTGNVYWLDIFLNFACAVSIGDRENENIFGECLIEGGRWEGKKPPRTKGYLDDGAMGRFLTELYAITHGIEADFSFTEGLRSEYRVLLDNWNSPSWDEQLAISFKEALSYHESLAVWHDDDVHKIWFETNPRYFIAAFELMALLKYRQRQGLEVPYIDHPLINPLWEHIKDQELEPDDEPVRLGVIARAKKEMPNFK
jgi:hypothetical protein